MPMQVPDVLALTRELVRIDTVNPPGNEQQCIASLHALLSNAGFRCSTVELAPTRTNLVAHIGNPDAGKPLYFTGHVDVVPLGTAPWKHAPFDAHVENGRLYGRGASDMKGGVAAFVCAALALADSVRNGIGVSLVITAGEETGCEGARQVVARGGLPAAGLLLVGEPTANQPRLGHKGALWLRASARGRTAHGSMPEQGDNAIYTLARAALALEDMDLGAAPHEVMGRSTVNVGTFAGGLNVNSVPDSAAMDVDIRTVDGQRHDDVVECVCHRLGPRISLRRLLDVESVYTPADADFIRRVFDICERRTRTACDGGTVSYFTDAAVLRDALGMPPVVILGPGEPELAHQTDEYCRVDRLYEAQALYSDLIRAWCIDGLQG